MASEVGKKKPRGEGRNVDLEAKGRKSIKEVE